MCADPARLAFTFSRLARIRAASRDFLAKGTIGNPVAHVEVTTFGRA